MCVKHTDEIIKADKSEINTHQCASYCVKNIGGCVATLDNFTELRPGEQICFEYFQGQTYCNPQPVKFPANGTNPKLLVRKFFIENKPCVQE